MTSRMHSDVLKADTLLFRFIIVFKLSTDNAFLLTPRGQTIPSTLSLVHHSRTFGLYKISHFKS